MTTPSSPLQPSDRIQAPPLRIFIRFRSSPRARISGSTRSGGGDTTPIATHILLTFCWLATNLDVRL